MSSSLSHISPFAAALPVPHVFAAYDADGDAIMTDAVTGLPITYGAKRSRSASVDSDGSDSRPSKRSRSSSEGEGDGEGDHATLASVMPAGFFTPKKQDEDGDGAASSSNAAVPSSVSRPCPLAPKKAPVGPSSDDDGDGDGDGDGHESALRNLAERMASVALEGEPRSPVHPPGSEPRGEDDGEDGEKPWFLSSTVSDLSLPLEFRHPRTMLQFFRFVSSYNELAPEGEEIHIPLFNQGIMDYILSHPSITNPAPEFAADIAELRAYLEKYRAPLQDEADDDGYDSYSSGPGRHYDSDSE